MLSMIASPGRSITGLLARLLATRTGKAPQVSAFESLEQRKLLANSPLPTIADLESPNNTVVRIETNYGDFDIELFNSAAPITVQNFLNYVTSGRYDETFFHRSAFNPDNSPFVLQGGGFKFDDTAGLSTVQTDAQIVRELTGRENNARTLAMARTNALNSATSQWFINYVDNDFLNPDAQGNGGYAVFGRIIQGWSVVQTIQGLAHPDLTGQAKFAGPESTNFSTVPVNAGFNATTGVRERDLVTIVNAEVIKPATTAGFFNQTLVYPEGFRSGASTESVVISNGNNVPASYQIIVHYETGIRDVVVAQGTIDARKSMTIQLSDFAQAGLNLVRSNTPYSVEVQSAFASTVVNPIPVSATAHRVDFNGAVSSDFYNVQAAPSGTNPLRTWDLPRIERNSNSREFITWQNLSDQTGTVTITFRTSTGTQSFTRRVEPFRRSGIELADLNLPAGTLSARVTSTVDLVVNASDWDLPLSGQNPQTAYTPAFGLIGVEGGGATQGGIAFVQAKNNFTNVISLLNMGSSAASVTLSFWPTGASNTTATTRTVLVQPNSRNDFSVTTTDLGVADGTTFAVTYASTAPIAAQYTSFDAVGRNTVTAGKRADGMTSAFSRSISPSLFFAGQLSPSNANQSEVISLFNPFADPDVNFAYTVRFIFNDGTVIDGASGTLGARGRADVTTKSLAAVLAKIASNAAFQNYTIQVFGTGTNSQTSFTQSAAGIVSVVRTDTTNGRQTMQRGYQSGQGLPLTDPVFAPNQP
ncbi:MAG TPA: peptidylprolyl isomerase [Phycisphaerales bacterium]|nr:peptidylprolyl isomerase [Phycisphaerales bacterium]